MTARKKPSLPTKIVIVEWLDACCDDDVWKSLDKVRKQKPVTVRTVGYLVKDEPDFVSVVNSIVLDDGMCGGDNTIPRGMIKSMKELG